MLTLGYSYMNSVFVFPGQGSQYCGMGKSLFAKYAGLVDIANEQLGYSIEELCLEDTKKILNLTEFTQPALYVVNALYYLDACTGSSHVPTVLAGHSLGEYSALYAAGAFDFLTGLTLVQRRGQLMSNAPEGAMVAIVNMDVEHIKDIIAQPSYAAIDIANINSRQQVVLSGLKADLLTDDIEKTFVDAGAKFIPLNVSVAFHSRYMKPVEDTFSALLQGIDFRPLSIPVVSNYTARFYPKQNYTDYLAKQISHPVKWYESISWLLNNHYKSYKEIGPGSVLTNLNTMITKDPMVILSQAPAFDLNESNNNITPAVSPTIGGKTIPRYESGLIFMFAGQGSQYYGMGKGLYQDEVYFRKHLEYCSDIVSAKLGRSLVDVILSDTKKEFDNIIYSHPAIFSVGYSLANMLIQKGIKPEAVLGHSLGEYIAAVIAGVLDVEDALHIIIKQAQLLQQHCIEGRMLSVLAPEALFRQRGDIFQGLSLGGVNYSDNFFVCGDTSLIEQTQRTLEAEGIIAVILPVRYAFHSSAVEVIKEDYLNFLSGITVHNPQLPIYSAMTGSRLSSNDLLSFEYYLWRIIREPISFPKLLTTLSESYNNNYLIDLSSTGTLSTFLTYGYPDQYNHTAAINRFSSNAKSISHLYQKLTINLDKQAFSPCF